MFEELESPKLPFDQCLLRERSPFSPLPQFFARTLPYETTQHPQKNRGRGGNMVLSSYSA
jgi:hypothetical protein